MAGMMNDMSNATAMDSLTSTETYHIILQPDNNIELDEDGSPPSRKRPHEDDACEEVYESSIMSILCEINKNLCDRLDRIERKVESVDQRIKYLEEKVVPLVASSGSFDASSNNSMPKARCYPSIRTSSGAIIIGLPQEKNPDDLCEENSNVRSELIDKSYLSPGSGSLTQSLGPNVTLITLNSEEDFPNGSWLGDENDVENRVRVNISPSDLLHIHSNCRTPEKMALALLDYLFDRNTQASSNLSGMGKHGKKQLDPLMIYGIRCHLVHKFHITEDDWKRIKLNIDSKCRTAFRRKMRGMPLHVKAFRGKSAATYVQVSQANNKQYHEVLTGSDDSYQQDESDMQLTQAVTLTHEQLAQLQQNQTIQLQDQTIQLIPANQIIFQQAMNGHEGMALTSDGIQLMASDGRETVHLSQNVIDELIQHQGLQTSEIE